MTRPAYNNYDEGANSRPVDEQSSRSGPYSINLPPQYRDEYETSAHQPDISQIMLPHERLSSSQAVRIVRQDFETAANYRFQNHDWRWLIADSLYTGWKQTKFWDGTKIPRSNISVYAAFDQIESIMPQVMQGLFNDPDWFEAIGRAHTTPTAARKIRDIIMTQLGDSHPRETLRRVVKSGVMYGNGLLDVGWTYELRRSLQFVPEFRPKMRNVVDPMSNVMNSVPIREFDRRIVEKVVEDYLNQPFIRYLPLKRCYIDPNCPSPLPSESRYFAHEVYMFIDDLDGMRKCAGFEDMPDLYTLFRLSRLNDTTQADMTQADQEASRRGNWAPWIDQSSDPAAARIRVIIYRTRDRIIWSLNNRYIVYNKPNPIGRITVHGSYYADLLDRFYAMSISDVVEPEQHVQEGLINSRFDELSLALHPTTVKKRGSGTPLYQTRVRPGGVAESEDPAHDVIRQYPMNATANAHLESQASEMRVQKHTGATDMAVLGVGTAANPAAKTATGAGIQGRAAASRMLYIIENIETTVIEPMLNDVFEYNQRFLDPNQMIEGANGEIDPIELFGAKVKFEMRASSRMQSRQALVTLMPMTLQAMLNPQLMIQLNTHGKTVDFVEMMQMFMDASGYRNKFNWVRDMTKEEMAMMAKQKPNQAEVDMQLQEARLSKLSDMQLSKQEMDMLKMFMQGEIDKAIEDIKAQATIVTAKEKAVTSAKKPSPSASK